jgi:hypothetical protein
VLYLEGSCFVYGDTISYLPFVEVVREYFGLDSTRSETQAKQQIGARLMDPGSNRQLVEPLLVPVTNFIRASKAGAPDPSGDNVETEPIAPGQPPGNGCVKRAQGRRRDTRRPASLDHRGGQPR